MDIAKNIATIIKNLDLINVIPIPVKWKMISSECQKIR